MVIRSEIESSGLPLLPLRSFEASPSGKLDSLMLLLFLGS